MINLKSAFGEQFRITYDESYEHKGIHVKDPAYMQIPCRLGTIYPFGGEFLCMEIDNHRGMAKRIRDIPGVELLQDGQSEKTFKFHVSLFDQITIIVVPKRKIKRTMTDEQKADLMQRIEHARKFKGRNKA